MARVEDEILASDFWSGETLPKAEQEGEIADEFQATDTDYGRRMQGQIAIGSKTKSITLNATSTKAIVKKYGKDTKKWIGKKVIVERVAQVVRGQKKQVVYISPK